MKKVILILLIAFSLNASNVMCEDSTKRFNKYVKLVQFALERKDYVALDTNLYMEIRYAEKALASCGDDWEHKDRVLEIRKAAIEVMKLYE